MLMCVGASGFSLAVACDQPQRRLDGRPRTHQARRDLAYTRYDEIAEALGCYAEYVEQPEEIRPALQRAWKKVEEGMVGFVNVKTDYHARATTVRFSSRGT